MTPKAEKVKPNKHELPKPPKIPKCEVKEDEVWKAGSKMANCKDPMDIALKLISQDDGILRALNNGSGKKKT